MAAVSVGILFVWSGIKGWSILGTLGDLITGVKPHQQTPTPLTDPNAASGGGASGTVPGSGVGVGSLANIATLYAGHAYLYGGAPGVDGSKPWDCSSFVNFVVGVKRGQPIPGYGAGKYDGSSHGPSTAQWAVWSGLQNITRQEVTAGDIILWVGHMGIAIGNTQMISALNPSEGTKVTAIEGTGPGPIIRTGRLTNA